MPIPFSCRPTGFRALFAILALLPLLAACGANPPVEAGQFRTPELVDVQTLEPGIRLDIRYAGPNNFTGRPLCPDSRALLQRPAAQALARAHRDLSAEGYGILVYDAYRPWSVTRALWEAATPEQRQAGFVADPAKGSKHNRGCAVDVGLYRLDSGRLVPMPSGYDEFSGRAHPDYRGGTADARRARDLLRKAMEVQGFQVSRVEWWHYDYRDWRAYPILDLSFKELSP
jgi:D-alanyl-D-alanine dipeptidase